MQRLVDPEIRVSDFFKTDTPDLPRQVLQVGLPKRVGKHVTERWGRECPRNMIFVEEK
jgi:hypothetical protein